MTGNPEAIAQLRTILSSREALYARAGSTVDTTGEDFDSSLHVLRSLVAERGYIAE